MSAETQQDPNAADELADEQIDLTISDLAPSRIEVMRALSTADAVGRVPGR